MLTRRAFGKLTLAGLAVPFRPGEAAASSVGGVRLGVQTYSFRDLPRSAGGDAVEGVLKAITDCGLEECELFAPQVEPRFGPPFGRDTPDTPEIRQAREQARVELRRWRLETPLSHFEEVRRKFDAAKVAVHAYNFSFNDSFTDAEIERGFEMARALGAKVITASATLSAAKRVAPFADKHDMVVAMHNHSRVDDPNEFATPESFAAARKLSKRFKINLDIGHFTAANYDPVAFLREHHADITNLHLKDRKKSQGDNLAWGQGDTPIKEVLQLLKKERWPIPAYVEYEYRGPGSSVEEVKKCLDYARLALA